MLWLAGGALAAGAAEQGPEAEANRSLAERQPLVVGATTDSFPYGFIDRDGQRRGFCVDLLNATVRVMNLRIKRVEAPSRVLHQRFRAGEFDLLQDYSDAPDRVLATDFTVPFLTLDGVLFVQKTGSPIKTLADLNGRSFALIGSGSIGESFLRDRGLKPVIVLVSSSDEALRAVQSGQCAATFVSRLTALSVIERAGLKNLEPFGEPFAGYDIRHCFAVHKGDAQLLARLNEGLAILHRTGEFDRIYRQWFGKFDAPVFTSSEVVNYVAAALALALLAALWGMLRQRALRKRIAGQAAQLAEKEALLQALYDNIPMAMCVLEAAPGGERVLAINRQAEVHFGVPVRLAAGRPLVEFNLEREWADELRDLLRRETAIGGFVREERRLAVARKYFVFTLVPLAPGSAGHARVCVLAEDVTDRRQLDEELAQTRKLRAVGELVGGIAHEFNNLLTPVMLKAGEIQLDWANDGKLQQQVAVIIQAAQRAAELTRRLLTFGRKGDNRAETVRLPEITASCFELLRQTVDRRIVFESAVPAELPPLYLNATDLNQILLNLLLNARDTLLEKLAKQSAGWTPCIRVEAEVLPATFAAPPGPMTRRPPAGWQRLTVRDNGLGMTPAVRERIFEPFYTTKEVGKGTGLGLATVWHLVAELGGRVELETMPGEGTAFRLLLPVWPAPPSPEAIPAPAKAAPQSVARVYLAEDDPLVAEAIAEALRRGGHQVTISFDGNAAWDHLASRLADYDLLVFDVNMPGLDGIELAHRARASHYVGRLMIVSGRLTLPQLQAINRARVDRVLAKPFSITEFSNAVRECLRLPA
jgi:signal transduction histidine kinase